MFVNCCYEVYIMKMIPGSFLQINWVNMVTVETCKRVLAYLFVWSHLNLKSLNINWLETSGFRVWELAELICWLWLLEKDQWYFYSFYYISHEIVGLISWVLKIYPQSFSSIFINRKYSCSPHFFVGGIIMIFFVGQWLR